MKNADGRRYYFVKHGLDAFRALPNFVWRTGEPRTHYPRGFRQLKEGDRWIGFAHTTSDERERPLSLVTGFFECTKKARYGRIPPKAFSAAQYTSGAWLIEGKPYRRQPEQPVGVPSINELLGRTTFNQTTFVPIDREEFEFVREYVLDHEFDPASIPLLGREPTCEQEVLAIVSYAHEALGIEKIVRARTRFPDMLVKLKGKRREVHLELEMYSSSFFNHRHHKLLSPRGLFPKKASLQEDRNPVGVLCWIDNDQSPRRTEQTPRVGDYVQRVFELQSLIREGEPIRW